MAESSYERGYKHGTEGAPGGGGNFLTSKLGPLPVWVWAAMGLGFAITYYLWQKKAANSTASASNTSTGTTGTTNASLIPQFVNQVYANTTPPTANSLTKTKTGKEGIPSTSVTINVPDGSGTWQAATFPSQAAVNTFFKNVGVTQTGNLTGYWPGGLTNAQINSAVTKAGGQVTSATGQSGWSY